MPDERFENTCAAIVCDLLGRGARWHRRDLPGAAGMRDFDIVFPDDRFEALEICAFTDSDAEAHRAARSGNDLLRSELLTRTWLVAVPLSARVKGLLSVAEKALQVYERWGRDEFQRDVDYWRLRSELGEPHELVDAAATLNGRGIERARSMPSEGDRPMLHLVTFSGGWLDPEAANRVIEDRAGMEDNQAKLAAARGATATHLFVPIRTASALTFAAVEGPPPDPPTLPSPITRAWVLAQRVEVMWVEPPSAWNRASVDPKTWTEPEAWRG